MVNNNSGKCQPRPFPIWLSFEFDNKNYHIMKIHHSYGNFTLYKNQEVASLLIIPIH